MNKKKLIYIYTYKYNKWKTKLIKIMLINIIVI